MAATTDEELSTFRDFVARTFAGRYNLSINKRRTLIKSLARTCTVPKSIDISAADIAGVPAWTLARSAGDSDPVSSSPIILYLHGGAFVSGGIESHCGLAGRIAATTGVPVLFVEYGLSPENPFPSALNDVAAVYQELVRTHLPASTIAICGDSAGGNLAIAALQLAKHNGLPMPAACAAISPALDLTLSSASYRRNAQADLFLSREGLAKDVAVYLAGHDASDPLASPLFAETEGLAPLLLQVGGNEVLIDETVAFARNAAMAGNTVRLEIYKNMTHAWQFFPDMLQEAVISTKSVADFLTAYLPRSVQ